MSADNVPNCKQSFKAIEGFFRRVAFNLGNSPSQTEVKIISCIPIDVTDLQQKIFQLQKELEEAKSNEKKETKSNQITSLVHTAIGTACHTCSVKRDAPANEEMICTDGFCNSSVTARADWPDTSSRKQRSTVSFLCPSITSPKYSYFQETFSNSINTERHRKPCECRKKFFSRKKKKYNTQFVYRAQTDNKTPFQNNFHLSDDATSKFFTKEACNSAPLGLSYLEDIVRRQHKAVPVMDTFSYLSDFSSPVCRDVPTCLQASSYEPDLCSCCNGQFQNVDNHMNYRKELPAYPKHETVENYKRNTYYDSNLYDLVPVKEKSIKMKIDIEKPKRKEPKPKAKFWPEDARPKYIVPHKRLVNYSSAYPVRDHYQKKVSPKSHNKRDAILNLMAAQQVVNPPHQNRDVDLSKICSVDFGPVYEKQITKNTKQVLLNADKNDNDAGCLPPANDNSTNGTPAACAENAPENKTEVTLNQIKNILQTVLTEVKINSKIRKSPDLEKKDAVVQNGPSQANILGNSQLLQSYTYSPCNINPYIASCSRQMPNSNNTFPGMRGKLMQQYPLFIQAQKHTCSCYRNVTNNKVPNMKRAACAATNTEHAQERSKETNQLIKEIYKSMALNIEIPSSKDNTVGQYTRLKSSVKDSIPMFKVENNKECKHVTAAISEIFRNSKALDSSDTKNTDTPGSTLVSKETSVESGRIMKSRHMARKVYRCSPNDNSTTDTIYTDIETNKKARGYESDEQSDATLVDKDTEPSTSETETDDVVVNVKKSVRKDETEKVEMMNKEKSGLFKKVLKIFKPRQRRRKNEGVAKEVQTETESDSDDYQTVYSQTVAAPKQKKVVRLRSRPHSKVFYSKQLQQRRSRTRSPEKNVRTSPYMEQEYRRYWDEKLMFHESEGRKRYSTDTYGGTTQTRRPRRPVYNQDYEARTALIDPIRQMPLRMPVNALPPKKAIECNQNGHNYSEITSNYPVHRQSYLRQGTIIPANRTNVPGNNFPVNSANYAKNNINYCNSPIRPHYIPAKGGQQPTTTKGSCWLKKRKLGFKCGQQWKELILES